MKIDLYNRECLEKLKELSDNSVDAIVTDPPYFISFMNKGWDKEDSIASKKEFWAECLRVTKPGGYLLAFGHSRTHHRLFTAIEDGGWEIRDTIMWLYGSGFPKSKNLGDGWGTALKPAHEPICMARKPFEGSAQKVFQSTSLGGINIDGCRVGNEVRTTPIHSTDVKEDNTLFGLHPTIQHHREETTQGRFPANIILDEEAGEILDEQAPQVGSMFKATRKKETSGGSGDSWTNGGKEVGEDNGFYDGLGGASRFFYCPKVSKKERNKGCDDLEKKDKAGKDFRPNHKVKAELGEDGNPYGRWGKIANNHPTVKPQALMEYLIKLVSKEEATILDPFMGSGSTGIAAKGLNRNFVGIEMDEGYYTIATKRIGE